MKATRSLLIESAATDVIDAYRLRFNSGVENYFGPIDEEIRRLVDALNSEKEKEKSDVR